MKASRTVTSRFWGSRNVRPSMRNLMVDMAGRGDEGGSIEEEI